MSGTAPEVRWPTTAACPRRSLSAAFLSQREHNAETIIQHSICNKTIMQHSTKLLKVAMLDAVDRRDIKYVEILMTDDAAEQFNDASESYMRWVVLVDESFVD